MIELRILHRDRRICIGQIADCLADGFRKEARPDRQEA